MRNMLLAATAFYTTLTFLLPGAATAQDRDWTGFYIGGVAGGVFSKSDIEFDVFSPVSMNVNGGALGATAGYNWDAGRFVYGVEADASFTNANDVSGGNEAELNSLLTLRARMGVKAGETLIYGTAGLAAAQVEFQSQVGMDGDPSRNSGFRFGGVGGIGAEFALTDNLSLKTEGLIFSIAGVDGVGDNGKGTAYNAEYQPVGATVRTGINLKF